jgi:signal peptidase I
MMRILTVALVVVALTGIIAVSAKTVLFLRIHEESMRPGLCPGDIIVVAVKKSQDVPLERDFLGRIVVFSNREGGLSVKRVYGLAGDKVTFSEGFVESSVRANDFATCGLAGRPDKAYIDTVPRDQIFLVGDNLPISSDSRAFGPVPEKTLVGEVVFGIPMRLGTCGCRSPVALGK